MIPATVLIPAHNEERYIRECLQSIVSQTQAPELIVVLADRCTDNTVTIVQDALASTRHVIVEKTRSSWKNNISENLQLGLGKATGRVLFVVDADMVLPKYFLERLFPQINGTGAVSSVVHTDPASGRLNRLVAFWELTYAIAPMGEQPRGGARAISLSALRRLGGFNDVYAWESDLDSRLRRAGFKVKLDRNVSVLHRRRMTLSHSVAYQIQAGRARKELHISFLRTLLHSVVRLRPFVIVGYLSK